jgi:DNA-binding CsgD family transcriptional regulator
MVGELQMTAASDLSFQNINEAIYEIAGGAFSWTGLMPMLAERSPDARFALVVASQGTHTKCIDQAISGYDENFIKSYTQHYQYINTWTKAHFHFGNVPKVFTTRDAAASPVQEELYGSEFYHDWVKPQDDIAEGVAIMLGGTEDSRISLTCNVPAAAADQMLPSLTSDFLALLKPVTLALRTRLLLEEVNVHRKNFELTLSTLNSAACVLSAKGHLIYANEVCKNLFSRETSIKIMGNGELRFKTNADGVETTFGQFLQDQTALNGVDFIIARDAGKRPLLVHFVTLAGYSNFLGSGQPRYLMFLTDPDLAPSLPSVELICNFLSLTPAEARVALALARGGRTADVARSLKLSPHTVRNQISSLMHKTGCEKQSDIATLVKSLGRKNGAARLPLL